jgi:hypothetical protein
MFSWGVLDGQGNVQRDPTFPDLPHFVEAYEMMHGEAPSGVEFDAYMAFFGSGFAAQKPVMLPEGTPDDIVQTYRRPSPTQSPIRSCRRPRTRRSAPTSRRWATTSPELYRVATIDRPPKRGNGCATT